MKERPILFSAPMVRAILAGRKTQSRRVAPIADLNIKPHADDLVTWGISFTKPIKGVLGSYSGGRFADDQARRIIASQFNPYGQPGDRLWVRESLTHVTSDPVTAERCSVHCYTASIPSGMTSANPYEANYLFSDDGAPPLPAKNVPSIHMPRWASRITLEIIGVRVERLQDISEDDAKAEGIQPFGDGNGFHVEDGRHYMASARGSFASLWRSINGPEAWETNPWVWVVEFQRQPLPEPPSDERREG